VAISTHRVQPSRSARAQRLLVVDDHASIRELLGSWARGRGFETTLASDAQGALLELERQQFDLVISDVRMPGLSGLDMLSRMPSNNSAAAVVFITAFGSVHEGVKAIREGALDYVTKPFNVEELFARIETRLGERRQAAARVESQVAMTRAPIAKISNNEGLLVGAPDNLARLYELLNQVAPSNSTVFINGPSGVGKELVAAEIHQRSNRSSQSFVRVNCPAIPRELQESELFGHEKGSFTGALRRKEGKFFFANGGTILLDEISETSLAFQSKLLRVLQEREYERVGGNDTIRLDVRLVATSNRNMAEMVSQGKFREDLFYRLNVVPVEMPRLRDRREDIPFLVEHFIAEFCRDNGRDRMQVTSDAMASLIQRPWAGNVRQLQNVCERAVVLKRAGTQLVLEDFFLHLEIDTRTAEAQQPADNTVNGMERDLILKTLTETHANRTEAARRLGISVRTLRNKLNEYRALSIDVDGLLQAASR